MPIYDAAGEEIDRLGPMSSSARWTCFQAGVRDSAGHEDGYVAGDRCALFALLITSVRIALTNEPSEPTGELRGTSVCGAAEARRHSGA